MDGTIVAGIPLTELSGVLVVTAVRMISLATVRTIFGSTRLDGSDPHSHRHRDRQCRPDLRSRGRNPRGSVLRSATPRKVSGVHREELPTPTQSGDERIALFRLDGAIFFGAAE